MRSSRYVLQVHMGVFGWKNVGSRKHTPENFVAMEAVAKDMKDHVRIVSMIGNTIQTILFEQDGR